MPVFNVARGKIGYYATLPQQNSKLVAALFKIAGQQADSAMADCLTLAQVKASNSEADFTNYARLPLGSLFSPGGSVIAPDMTLDMLSISTSDITWAAAGGPTNNSLGRIVFFYDPDTTAAAHDGTCIPLTFHNFVTTTDGTPRRAQINAGGFWSSRNPT